MRRPTRPTTDSYWNREDVTARFEVLQPPQYLLSMLAVHPPRQPLAIGLDVGCGAGRNLQPLADAGYRPFGIDAHLGMLEAARRSCVGATLQQASMTAIPLDDRMCEIAICHGVLHNLESASAIALAVRELARVMTLDARLSLNTFSSAYIDPCLQPTGEPDRFRLPNGQLMTLLKPEDIENIVSESGLLLLSTPATYLSEGDPGQRSVWRAVLGLKITSQGTETEGCS